MKLGNLNFQPIEDCDATLVGAPVQKSIDQNKLKDVKVAEIDPDISDTEAFCKEYGIELEVSVNCVIVEAKRADRTWYAACLIPATQRADINGIVRRELDARKISFAPKDMAIKLTNMEFGGISPIGLPADWPILVDSNATSLKLAIVGSGVRKSKLLISGSLLASLPNAKILSLIKTN
jgi:prolyl-tRNA editing enzyme YbaK/EbsC (Cys-tRNA(Pro) deacylase)